MTDTHHNQNWQPIKIEKHVELYWSGGLDDERIDRRQITMYNISSVRAWYEIGPAGIRN